MIPLMMMSIMMLTISIEHYLTLRTEKRFPAELSDVPSSFSQFLGNLDPPVATWFANSFLFQSIRQLAWRKSNKILFSAQTW